MAFAGTLLAAPAGADFRTAHAKFESGDYDAARREFLALAALGDAPSQFNLGAMAQNGNGVPAHPGEAVGWLTAARENGSTAIDAATLERLRARLSPGEAATATRIVATYGRTALEVDVLPRDWWSDPRCAARRPKAEFIGRPRFPGNALARMRTGAVIVEFLVAPDGRVRDPDFIVASPLSVELFARSAERAVLGSRYEPPGASFADGISAQIVYTFQMDAQTAAHADERVQFLKGLQNRSLQGDIDAQFLLGLATLGEPGKGELYEGARQLILMAAQGGNADAQFFIARQFSIWRPCASERGAALWLREAATRGNESAAAHIIDKLLTGAPGPEAIEEARVWLRRIADSPSPAVQRRVLAHLAASPFPELRDATAAARIAEDFDRQRPWADPQVREALAAGFAAGGDFRRAVERQRDALAAAREFRWNTAWIEQRLACYRAHRVWRGDLLAVPADSTASPAPGACTP